MSTTKKTEKNICFNAYLTSLRQTFTFLLLSYESFSLIFHHFLSPLAKRWHKRTNNYFFDAVKKIKKRMKRKSEGRKKCVYVCVCVCECMRVIERSVCVCFCTSNTVQLFLSMSKNSLAVLFLYIVDVVWARPSRVFRIWPSKRKWIRKQKNWHHFFCLTLSHDRVTNN